MLSKDEVKHIAKLARLDLTQQELLKFRKDLSSILGYVGKLKEVDISGVEPMTHSVFLENIVRGDNQEPKFKELVSKLLKLAPKIKEGYFKVNSILK